MVDDDEDERKSKGLTAAISYLHSRGRRFFIMDVSELLMFVRVGIDALFLFDIDGDVGEDPNAMTLWFSQPGLGLPSKVRPLTSRTTI
jgi:endothelin-converting enzyme